MRHALPIAIATVFALAPAVAAAQLYKWVDEKGVTHYTETPPPDGRGKALDIKTQRAGGNAGSTSPDAPKPAARGTAAKAPPGKPAQPARTPVQEEIARLSGNWATPEGRSPHFSILFQADVFDGRVRAQYALRLSTKSVVGGKEYELSGGGGKGTMQPDLSTSDKELGIVADRIDYAIKGDEMEVTLGSGSMKGTYRVIRSAR